MASYSQQPFYNQPATIYPPTPTPTHQPDDFSPIQPFPSYAGFDFNFEPQPNHHQNIPQSIRGHTPIEHDTQQRTRSSSEEKELTPGQRVSHSADDGLNFTDDGILTPRQRRKEQNRAAQRAFRERKERHVKELEHRLKTLEQHASETAAQNDILKQELQKTKLENKLLLHENNLRGQSPPELGDVAAMSFKPTDHTANPPTAFTTPIFGEHPNRGPLHRISTSPKTGERLLGAGAAWDLIVLHPLYEQGLVDIGDISERLKGLARCDGQGPVFEESVILDAIQASSGSGRDELLVESPGSSHY